MVDASDKKHQKRGERGKHQVTDWGSLGKIHALVHHKFTSLSFPSPPFFFPAREQELRIGLSWPDEVHPFWRTPALLLNPPNFHQISLIKENLPVRITSYTGMKSGLVVDEDDGDFRRDVDLLGVLVRGTVLGWDVHQILKWARKINSAVASSRIASSRRETKKKENVQNMQSYWAVSQQCLSSKVNHPGKKATSTWEVHGVINVKRNGISQITPPVLMQWRKEKKVKNQTLAESHGRKKKLEHANMQQNIKHEGVSPLMAESYQTLTPSLCLFLFGMLMMPAWKIFSLSLQRMRACCSFWRWWCRCRCWWVVLGREFDYMVVP